ncbi:MAG TPA: hypothetical protein VKR26_09830 [Terriglobales bacterium]|jgi:hypothetical protein|nr:hypothetical protein [Terriglobales bacterium]
MAAPAQQSIPGVQSPKPEHVGERREPTMEDMLRECIELCAQVAERHAAPEAAQHIRRLKPASRWP